MHHPGNSHRQQIRKSDTTCILLWKRNHRHGHATQRCQVGKLSSGAFGNFVSILQCTSLSPRPAVQRKTTPRNPGNETLEQNKQFAGSLRSCTPRIELDFLPLSFTSCRHRSSPSRTPYGSKIFPFTWYPLHYSRCVRKRRVGVDIYAGVCGEGGGGEEGKCSII